MLWADMATKYPDELSILPKETVFVVWNYGWETDRYGDPDALIKKSGKRRMDQKTECARFDDVVQRHIQHALRLTHGKIKGPNGAAQLLGLHPSTLKGKMKKLDIK